jgi:hypothetical protein
MEYGQAIRKHHAELHAMFRRIISTKAECENLLMGTMLDKDIRTELCGMVDQISDLEIAFREYGIGPSLIDPVDMPYEIKAEIGDAQNDCRGER